MQFGRTDSAGIFPRAQREGTAFQLGVELFAQAALRRIHGHTGKVFPFYIHPAREAGGRIPAEKKKGARGESRERDG